MKTFLNGNIILTREGTCYSVGYNPQFDALAVHGVTSLILAMEAEGLLPESENPKMNAAIQTAIDAIGNNS